MRHVSFSAPEVIAAADVGQLLQRQKGNKYVKGNVGDHVVEAADGDQLL